MCLLPIVVFGPEVKAEDIRRQKPILFQAILAVACNTIRPDLQMEIANEMLDIFAVRIVRHGDKSLEVVQSLQVMSVYYQPPEKYEELNFNQLIHMSAVMGIDIGIGKRAAPGSSAPWREYMYKMAYPPADAPETRRAWLGVYFLCANAAMSLRRTLLIRWSPYMEESLQVLAKSPDALPSDKWLAHFVKIQHIAEEVGYQFSMDDPPSDVSITQPKVQYQLKTFEKQLDEWRAGVTEDMPQLMIQHMDGVVDLYIHEIAMHHSHNIDDFRPPFGVMEEDPDAPEDYITAAHIESLMCCLHSIHRIFDAFLAMTNAQIRALPTIFFVRNSYAAVALIKMHTAITAKGSTFGSVFKPEDLKVEHYLEAVFEKLRQAGEGGQCRTATKFIHVWAMFRNWQGKRAAGINENCEKMGSAWNQSPQPELSKTSARKAGQNPLHVLSEAASGNNNNNNPDPSSTSLNSAALAAPSSLSVGCWDPTVTTNTSAAPTYNNMTDGAQPPGGFMDMAVGIDNFVLSEEDLEAIGHMLETPGWIEWNLGIGGGGGPMGSGPGMSGALV